MDNNLLFSFPNIEAEEILFITEAIKGLDEQQKKNFILLYQGCRKDPQVILICTLIGFVGCSGIQRFLLGQIGMGILYFFTGGLCVIGTVVDLINYKKMSLEFNQKVVVECVMLSKTI